MGSCYSVFYIINIGFNCVIFFLIILFFIIMNKYVCNEYLELDFILNIYMYICIIYNEYIF